MRRDKYTQTKQRAIQQGLTTEQLSLSELSSEALCDLVHASLVFSFGAQVRPNKLS